MYPKWNDPDAQQAFGFDRDNDTWLKYLRTSVDGSHPERIGPYRVLEEVATGAQGIVFRAEHERSGDIVALKLLLRGALSSQRARLRFERELEIVAGLDHPGVVSLLGMEEVNGTPVLVFDWIEGLSPGPWLAEHHKRTGIKQTLQLFLGITAAVHHAHQRGVIHRDLKPGNILVDDQGQTHILDFGIASITLDDTTATDQITQTFEFLGTPAYSAPEHLLGGSKATDVRGDVYSLGVILYQLLTNELPCAVGSTLEQAVDAVRNHVPRRPSSHVSHIRQDLDNIVLKAIAVEPDLRYSSVDAFDADIHRFLAGQPVEAHPPSAWYQLRKTLRRNAPMSIAALLVFVTALVFGAYSWSQRQHAEMQRASTDDALHFIQEIMAELNPVTFGVRQQPKEILDRATLSLQKRFPNQPEIRATLLTWIGESQNGAGDYQGAKRNLAEADAILQRLGQADSAQSIRVHFQLAFAYLKSSDFDQAEAWLRQTENEQRSYGADMATELARTQTSLIELLSLRGRYKEARAMLQETRELHLELHGAGSAEVLEDDFRAADLLVLAGDFDAAEEILHKLLAVNIEQHGSDSLAVARVRREIGNALSENGNVQASEDELREALRLYRKHLPVNHPDIGITLGGLGNLLLFKQVDLQDAQQVLEEALLIFRSSDLPNHLSAGKALVSLAAVKARLEAFDEADVLLQEAQQILRNRLGENHPAFATALLFTAGLRLRIGQPEEAIRLAQRGHDITERVLGEGHYKLAESLNLLANAHIMTNDFQQAIAFYEQATALVASRDPLSFHLVVLNNNVGALHLRQKNLAAAEQAFSKTLAICDELGIGIDNPDYFGATLHVAMSCYGLERYAEALLGLEKLQLSPLDTKGYQATKLRATAFAGACLFRAGAQTEGIKQMRDALEELERDFAEWPRTEDVRQELQRYEALLEPTAR